MIIYQGPSKIDGSPIIAVYIKSSKNKKTGDIGQVHIIRSDIDPITASRSGADFAICGDCKHRGQVNPDKTSGWSEGRSCYVNLVHGPLRVYKAYKAGKYKHVTLEELPAIGNGAFIRLGAYGDPMAVPSHIFRALLSQSTGHTSYTHQSKNLPDDNITRHMISADTPEEALNAHSKGLRTFRVIPLNTWQDNGRDSLLDNEILCPASKEAGARVQCKDCKLCGGQSIKAKSIAIPAHGVGAKHA